MNGKMLAAAGVWAEKDVSQTLRRAAAGCRSLLLLPSDALWDAPELIFPLAGTAPIEEAQLLRAAAELPGVAAPTDEGVEREVTRLGLALADGKPAGVWFETDGRKPARTYQPKRRVERMTRKRYARGVMGVPDLDGALAALDARHPLASVLRHGEAVEFALKDPAPLTTFLRLDIAVPFASRAPELAARHPELTVAGFGLRGGAMTLLLT